MKKALIIACLLGTLSVILGAFGAHSLKEKLDPNLLESFKTGVRYMFLHAIVILVINSIKLLNNKTLKLSNSFFFIGILFFTGSILAIVMGVPAKLIWFVTPLGGLILILGWLSLAYGVWRNKEIK
jgi:uncharacterized membrane protein YgdD (TMEM256/DUF423 family)